MTCATFVLSTGRCGTQWLAQSLATALGGTARVEHEPLHDGYEPRRLLGAAGPAALDAAIPPRGRAHADGIERTLADRDYLETGHPCWAALPWLALRLPGRVRVVHLVRHPVPTACSWVSHGAYVPPLLPHLRPKEPVAPHDAGSAWPEYRGPWPSLAPVEKCLYYWAEVNAFALRLERSGGLPWLRLRYEELFGPAGEADLARLAAFLGRPPDLWRGIDRGARVDRYRSLLAGWPEPERIARHPRIAALAAELGYDAGAFAAPELAARFLPGAAPQP